MFYDDEDSKFSFPRSPLCVLDSQENYFDSLSFSSPPLNFQSDNFLNDFTKQEILQLDSDKNTSKKRTSSTNESPNNSSENNIQKSDNISPKTPINFPTSENPLNSNELEIKYTQEINLENTDCCPLFSFNQINDNYGSHFIQKGRKKLRGEGNNVKNLEKKLSRTKGKYNKQKKEKETEIEKEIKKKIETENFLGRKREIREEEEKKRGRKSNANKTEKHTKMGEDNLMFKIRSNFNNWLLLLINKFLPKGEKLKKIKFLDFSKRINAKENIEFLRMKIGDIFSSDISKLYKKEGESSADYNKKIIDEIMKSGDEKVKLILNLTYKDALDLYRFKENETNLKEILGEEFINEIKGRVDEFLFGTYDNVIKNKIGESEADEYVSSLLVMIYNYERWFMLKSPRKKSINIEIQGK